MRISPTLVLAALALTFMPAAGAQTPKPYEGEIIMTRSGDLVAPWKEIQVCGDRADGCRTVVFNPITKEAARLDGRWSTRFEATGNGQEVQRGETARDKAIRLKASP